MASFGAGYTTKGALLLSAYDRCRKACFPLHSHTGFLREELQCFCVHASFLLLSAKNISNQINIQADKVTGHRSCLTKSFPWWVLDQGNYFQLQNFVFFFSFWPASTLILSYGDCVTITILSWHNWGLIEQNQSLTSSLNDGSNFFSTCVTWKNYMYYNIYPKFITNLHRLHAYITNLIQHKCVSFTRFRKRKCHW